MADPITGTSTSPVGPPAHRASEMHPALNQLQQPAQQATQPLAGPFVV